MTDRSRPAWAHDSIALRLPKPGRSEELTPEAAFSGATGEGVRVAVIDSGVDADHPMLDDCVDNEGAIDFSVDTDGEVVATSGSHGDLFGHGTAVAGIIHALAPAARITSVRVLGPNLSGKAAAFHAGLSWAVDEGFDVVNLSLGTTRSEWALAFHEVCDRAYFGNTFVVTAANNVQRASYPSLFASVASVACNTSDDPLRFHANPHPPTEFLARGIDIEVPWIDGGTITTTGNSFAAPHIAGLATLIKSKHPELRPFQLKAALWATSANVLESSPVEPAGRRTTMFVGGAAGASVDTPQDGGLTGYQLRGSGSRTRWGTLWDAEHRQHGRMVSIHQLDEIDRDPASASTELRTAVERIRAIGHPRIANTLEVIDRPWLGLVGEYRKPVIEDAELTTMAAAIALTKKVCSALAAAHAVGIVHGGLALSSLSTGESGPVIHDLELVTALGVPSPTAVAALDPKHLGHLAPELLEDKPATVASDVYSIGVLIHRLLSGQNPYPDDVAIGRYLRERLSSAPPQLGVGGRDLPQDLVGLVEQCLSIAPANRPASIDELAVRLDQLSIGGEDVRGVEAIPPDLDPAHIGTGSAATNEPDRPVSQEGSKNRRWGINRRGGQPS